MPVERERCKRIAILYGLACHACFTIGVLSMIAAMFFGMSQSLGRVPAPWANLANGALLLQFPLVHSLLLSKPGRAFLARLAPRSIGAPMTTTCYVIVASLQTLGLFALWTPSGIVWWTAHGPGLWLLIGLYALSWLLLLKAIWDAGISLQTGFLGWWAVVNNRRVVFPPMPTTGLFRLVRQPIYVAFACTLWTVPCWTPDQLTVSVVLTLYCLLGPLFKERRLRERYGKEYRNYAATVPYWLPGGMTFAWIAGLATLIAMLSAAARFRAIGLEAAMTSIGAYMLGGLALWCLRGRRGDKTFGSANFITLLRAAIIAMLPALIFDPDAASRLGGWPLVAGGILALGLGGIDGSVARRFRAATPFGARFDLEVNALFILGLSVLIWRLHLTGAWVLLSGAMRYIWAVALLVWPRLRRPLPHRLWRSGAAIAQISLLLAALIPGLPPAAPAALAGIGLACLTLSFGRDLLWLLANASLPQGPNQASHEGTRTSRLRSYLSGSPT